jgi:serine/threonine protein kinase
VSSLFLSYRRSDAPGTVKQLYDRLKSRLPQWRIFYDHEVLLPGQDLPERLHREVTSAAVVLCVIGPRWVTSLKERQRDPGVDHVHEEVRLALRAGHTVIPVLVENAAMPTDIDLVEFPDLQPLCRLIRQAVRPGPDFDTDIERLAAQLDSLGPGIGAGFVLGGRYKILREISRGGMGVVYEAEQQKPRRRVAVKMILEGMDTKDILARFDGEKEALARMDHPNIAGVIDSGASPSGKPYFVMDLVPGEPITVYCDRKKLPLKNRLELLRQVCAAAQHAHQKAIIHRDIKPSNVLVEEIDGCPIPKVIDFGLAKALAGNLTDKTLISEIGKTVGTLIYASPEQLAGRQYDVDTRTDVYGLGALLYELIAGIPPFTEERLKQVGDEAMRREIIEKEPPKPSTKLSSSNALPSIAANRQVEPRKLAGLISGELDWIVLRALEKDPNQRYDTAGQLSDDIERYLKNEPVTARAPSLEYRLAKFVRRNRIAVVAGCLVLGSLAAGVVGTSIGMSKAMAQEQIAKKALDEKGDALEKTERALAEVTAMKGLIESQYEELKAERKSTNRMADYAGTIKGDERRSVDQVMQVRMSVAVAHEVARSSLEEAVARRAESELLRTQKSAVEQQANGLKMERADLNDTIRDLERQLNVATKRNSDSPERLTTIPKAPKGNVNLNDDQAAQSTRSQAGEVKRVREQDNDIELTIGSGAGLAVGQELFVYRTKPRAEFLGKVLIVGVGSDGAVARVVGNLYKHRRIEMGDLVSSTIKPPF